MLHRKTWNLPPEHGTLAFRPAGIGRSGAAAGQYCYEDPTITSTRSRGGMILLTTFPDLTSTT